MIEYTDEQHDSLIRGHRKQLADVRATVEALQAEKLMLERGVSAQSALIDGLQSQLIQRTAALEAVQHERDEANSHVKFLGATKQANGSFCLDMKKYHARYRCGRHRDDPWKGIDTEIDCFVCLKHDLDAERAEIAKVRATCDMLGKERNEADEAKYHAELKLTQLQGLVETIKCELFDRYDGAPDSPTRWIGSLIRDIKQAQAALTPAGQRWTRRKEA